MMKQQNCRNDYLKNQLISYIGNKRKLLPLIEQVISEQKIINGKTPRFLDLFAGSGAVSRLANSIGFQVIANDWEEYAYQINRCYLLGRPESADSLFAHLGGLRSLEERFDGLESPTREEQYIARFYAPKSNDPFKALPGRERLFYTRENALRLDSMRNYIDSLCPPDDRSDDNQMRRSLMLGPLLYLASKHTNTSGVFKAYHRGFGGYGKDALSRILHPIRWEIPVLWQGNQANQVHCEDANTLAQSLEPVDIAYLDPPYNQHQYGSNYHMLNSLALWDKPPQPLELNDKGELARKAAIREDWKKTRSDYCIKGRAGEAFHQLIGKLQAKNIIISYSTDGIIPLEEMRKICESKGRISLVSNEYAVYRGGRQSNSRKHRNLEFLWVIETGGSNTRRSRSTVDRHLLKREIEMLAKHPLRRKFLVKQGRLDRGFLYLQYPKCQLVLDLGDPWKIQLGELPDQLTLSDLKSLKLLLEEAQFQSREEELMELLDLFPTLKEMEKKRLAGNIYNLLKKLAHPPTLESFKRLYKRLVKLEQGESQLQKRVMQRKKLAEIAELRMNCGILED